MPAVRVKTSSGWQDIAIQGATGGAVVYEQPTAPATPPVGAIWIDTDDSPALGVGGPVVTSLPTPPVDGQEIRLLVDATTGIVWHLRWRAASPNNGKWEFLGGPPLYSFVGSPSTPAVTGSWTSPVDWPAIPIPIPGIFGEWIIDLGGRVSVTGTTTVPNFAAFQVGFGSVTLAGTTMYLNGVAGQTVAQMLTTRGKQPSANYSGWPYRLGYALYGSAPNPAEVSFSNLWISVLPVRLGIPPY